MNKLRLLSLLFGLLISSYSLSATLYIGVFSSNQKAVKTYNKMKNKVRNLKLRTKKRGKVSLYLVYVDNLANKKAIKICSQLKVESIQCFVNKDGKSSPGYNQPEYHLFTPNNDGPINKKHIDNIIKKNYTNSNERRSLSEQGKVLIEKEFDL